MKSKSWIQTRHRAKGFTLIEMVIVIAIIAMLILLIAPNLGAQKDRASDKADDAFRTTLQTQYELAKEDHCSSFAEMAEKDYLTKQQLEKANAGYLLENGVVITKDGKK